MKSKIKGTGSMPSAGGVKKTGAKGHGGNHKAQKTGSVGSYPHMPGGGSFQKSSKNKGVMPSSSNRNSKGPHWGHMPSDPSAT